MLQVKLLGEFDVRAGGKQVVIPSRSGQSLFAYLVLTAGTAHRREKLAGLFWPETPDENARHNLRQELWRIRKALSGQPASDGEYLLSDEISITFNPHAPYWLDVAQLERASPPEESSTELSTRLGVYRGELLPGFYDDWVVLERERLKGLFETRMQQLMERLIREQRWATVQEWAERWIALGQTPEPAYRALMLAYAMLGDRAKSSATFDRCSEALERELGVEPAPETQKLYEELKRGESVTGVNLTLTQVALVHTPASDEPPAPGEPPFKGLQYFDEPDADLFFGRESLTAKLVARLRDNCFLAIVVGASGSGKSSIVRAGLIPALKRGEPLADGILPPEGSANWDIRVMTPTAHPLHALAAALTRESESVTATATLMDDLAQEPRSLYLFLRRQITGSQSPASLRPRGPEGPGPHYLLLVDQFEELFTLCRDEFEREAFIDNLLTAVEPLSPPGTGGGRGGGGEITLILAIRADFYAHLAQYPELREAVAQQQEYIGPMSADELRRAIEGPARREGWQFDPGLVDLILRDVGNEPGALPLLSHALLETWKRRSGRRLTLKGYAESGEVRGAIAHTAETVYQELPPGQQAIARDILLRLTELGEGTEDTRRRAALSELTPASGDAGPVQQVINLLADARLITTSEGAVEVAHEALIREWQRLREWLNQDREGLKLHRQLTEAAQEWELLDRDPGALYRGARLAQASEWATTNEERPLESGLQTINQRERAFLDASREAEQHEAQSREAQRQRELQAAQELAEEQKRRAEVEAQRAEEQRRAAIQLLRRARFLAGAFLLALVMAGIALFFGEQARQSAVTAQANARSAEQERRTAFSRELAASAINNLDTDPDLSLLLALQAVSVTYSIDKTITAEAENALHRVVPAARAPLTLRGHTDWVERAAFSPDGTRIGTVSEDGSSRVWDSSTGKEILNLSGDLPWATKEAAGGGGLPRTSKVLFSRDGSRMTTLNLGAGGTAIVKTWDLNSGKQLQAVNLSVPANGTTWNALSPDGTRMAFGSGDGPATVWDLTNAKLLMTLEGHTGWVTDVEFSPDGTRIATASWDGTAKIWDAGTGNLLLTLSGHTQPVMGLAFSPDGTRVATASNDSTAKVWDARTGKELVTLSGHTNFLTSVAFSPDGKRVATAGIDRKAIVWDAEKGTILFTFLGHGDIVEDVAFSPDGKRLVTASRDHTAKVWELAPTREWLTLSSRLIWGFSMTGDGKRVAAAHPGGAVDVWDAATDAEVEDTRKGAPPSASGLLATLPGKGLNGGEGYVDIAFSPDGSRLARANQDDATVQVWDVAAGKVLLEMTARQPNLVRVAYSPDGRQIAATGADRTEIWDAATGNEILSLPDPQNHEVDGVAYSPDGNLIATGSYDATAEIWDAHTGEMKALLTGHTNIVFGLAFSPDGKRLVTGSRDGTAKLWEVATGKELFTLSGHTSTVFAVTFSHDGTRIATASYDASTKIWDAATGKELLTLYGHTNGVDGVAFTPDDTRLITSSEDGTVRIYLLRIEELVALARTRLSRTWTGEECQRYLHSQQCPSAP